MIQQIRQTEYKCCGCPLLFCVDWDGEYECSCSVDENLKIDDFSSPVPEDCPLKTGHIMISIISGKIAMFKKTGSL